jgi:hypothetical protein
MAALGRAVRENPGQPGQPSSVRSRVEEYLWWGEPIEDLRKAISQLWLEGPAEAVEVANRIWRRSSGLVAICFDLQRDGWREDFEAEVKTLNRLRTDLIKVARRDLQCSDIDILAPGLVNTGDRPDSATGDGA